MPLAGRGDLGTHAVENQPGPPDPVNLTSDDPALADHARAAGADWSVLAGYGEWLGEDRREAEARDVNRQLPELATHGPDGRRIDEIGYHPAYHAFMAAGLSRGYAALAWEGNPGGHATHAGMVYLASQVEPGHTCPMTMTYAAIPLIRDSDLADRWLSMLMARGYDPSVAPVTRKRAATLGMAMTEKQGGSDLRTNTTQARPAGDHYRLVGHKWFCSAPMSDGFLTLAQAPGGLTCFLAPRWLESERNAICLIRLKDKLGNRSNASAEIEYEGAVAYRLGEEGAGIRTILEMVHHTRLDTALAPAGLMRAALRRAHHWTTHRTAFQRRLADQPLMRTLLADLALDWEGALALGLRVARSFDRKDEAAFARISVALAKYLNNKLCVRVVAEAMEVLGGMGYVEESGLPLLYREAPLNGIWEGSGNVICLDILRTLARVPEAASALEAELDAACGQVTAYDAARRAHRDRWCRGIPEALARAFAEETGILLSAACLITSGPPAVAEAFAATRLAAARGISAGTRPVQAEAAILDRLRAGPSLS